VGRAIAGAKRAKLAAWLGVAQSRLCGIFAAFYQIDNPARDLRRGRGLGLAIVQRLGDLGVRRGAIPNRPDYRGAPSGPKRA